MKSQRPHFRRDGDHRKHVAPPMQTELPVEDEEESLESDDVEAGVKREAEYLRRLTEDQTPVEVHLKSGENFRGYIEYYDRRFIRLTRKGAPNLFIYKDDIKYLSEAGKEPPRAKNES